MLSNRVAIVAGMASGLLLLTGCAMLDGLLGSKPGDPSPVGSVAAPLAASGGLIGLVASLLLGAGNVYQVIRGKQAQGKAQSIADGLGVVVKGIDKALDGGLKPSVSKDELYSAIQKVIEAEAKDPQLVLDMISAAKLAARGV